MIGWSPLGGSLPIRILKQLTAIHPTQSFPSVTRKDRFGVIHVAFVLPAMSPLIG